MTEIPTSASKQSTQKKKPLLLILLLGITLTALSSSWYLAFILQPKTFTNLNEVTVQDCTYASSTVQNGTTRTFYSARTVESAKSCTAISEVRSCTNGTLSGDTNFAYDTCTVLERFTGVNLNRHPEDLDISLMNNIGATWMRANADILTYAASSSYSFADWSTFKTAHTEGKYGIVNLMWDFERYNERIPVPESAREKELFHYLDTEVLPALLPTADIIVVGNEPFVNTLEADWAYNASFKGIPVVTFYTRVAAHLEQYLNEHSIRDQKKIYMGAFTRLYSNTMQTGEGKAAVAALLTFADSTPYIDGIDIHTHVVTIEDITASLVFVGTYSQKPIIDTEYTYVHAQAKFTDQAIGKGDAGAFAKKYQLNGAMTVTDFMKTAVAHPLPKQEWDDFFRSRPWTIDHFIIKADDIFKQYPVHGATFGFIQTDVNFRNPLPWYMNSLFIAATIEHLPNGQPQGNYQYLTDFESLQNI